MAFVTSSAHNPSSIFHSVIKNNPNPTTSSSSPSLPPPPVAVLPRSRSRAPSAPATAFVVEDFASALSHPPLLHSPLPASGARLGLGLGFSSCSPWQVRVWEDAGGDAEMEEEEEDEERSMALEAEIYEFMKRSSNPSDFPTKDQLVAAGRMDLVQEISSHGGWLALGWDLEEEEVQEEQEQDDRIFQQQRFRVTTTPSSLASSSGRPTEMEGGEDVGIEGILSRLEKERKFSYAVGSGDENVNGRVSQGNGENHRGLMVGGSERSSRSLSLNFGDDLFHGFGDLLHSQHGDFSESDDKRIIKHMSSVHCSDTEIIPNGNGKRIHGSFLSDISMDYDTQDGRNQPQFEAEENCQNQIRSRIRHLESELTYALSLLRSRTNGVATHKDQPSSLKELHKLSDALEFQENEIMNTRDKLRSMRSKLAVLEGKMALELIEARKTVEEKQRKIDAAQKTLRLLRTACIVWPTSASEVLLTGSFDGWTSQRRMERSSTGVFSLYLKLYPGRYEIKFIVDGVWIIDPLRPIVHTNGYENNLLIVS